MQTLPLTRARVVGANIAAADVLAQRSVPVVLGRAARHFFKDG
jgi:hypothetical protein